MNRVTIASALATFALVVPAGWRALEADIQADGPKLRPPQKQLEIGDATVTLDMDRGIMPAGGKASVTLVATSDRPHRVTVALRALEDMGYGDERVPNPPREIERRTITLDAQPGGGAPVVATFQLAKTSKRPGVSEWFDVVATSREAHGESAWVGVATWSGNSFAMAIEAPAQVPVEGAFTIAVRVKNTTKKPIHMPYIELGGRIGGPQGLDSQLIADRDDYAIEQVEQPEDVDLGGHDNNPLAPGAEHLTIYRVLSRFGVSHFTFVAQARCEEGGAMATLEAQRPAVEDGAPTDVQVSRR